MKKLFISLLLLFAVGTAWAQYPSWQDIFVNTIHPQGSSGTAGVSIKNNAYSAYAFLIKNSRGSTVFSVDSSGKPTGVGIALTGLTVLDSGTVAAEWRQGGLVSYDQMLSIKNNAVNSKILSLYNSRNTLLIYGDSAGVWNADTLVIDENSRLGGLAAYGQRFSVKNNAVNALVTALYNSRNTLLRSVDSSGVEYSSIAGIDSFATTAATDSVTLPSGSGLTTSSKPEVWAINPTWSTEVDTAKYSGQIVITGAGLTKLVVSRVKSYTGNGATAVKSGAHYAYDIKK